MSRGFVESGAEIFKDGDEIFRMPRAVKEAFDVAQPAITATAKQPSNSPRIHNDAHRSDCRSFCRMPARPDSAKRPSLILSDRFPVFLAEFSSRNFIVKVVGARWVLRNELYTTDFASIVLFESEFVLSEKGDSVLALEPEVFGAVSRFDCWDLFCSRHCFLSANRSAFISKTRRS
jgi:hypothetical protein